MSLSISEILNNLSETMKDVVKRASADGKVLASKELIDKRKEVCYKCEHLVKRKCKLCGCYLDLKWKLLEAKCEDNRWV